MFSLGLTCFEGAFNVSHVHTKPEAPQSQGNDPNFWTISPGTQEI